MSALPFFTDRALECIFRGNTSDFKSESFGENANVAISLLIQKIPNTSRFDLEVATVI